MFCPSLSNVLFQLKIGQMVMDCTRTLKEIENLRKNWDDHVQKAEEIHPYIVAHTHTTNLGFFRSATPHPSTTSWFKGIESELLVFQPTRRQPTEQEHRPLLIQQQMELVKIKTYSSIPPLPFHYHRHPLRKMKMEVSYTLHMHDM